MYDTSIIIPCYNEERTVNSVVKKICSKFPSSLVVLIDDGSTDNSLLEVEKINSTNLKIIALEKNMGKGFAMRTGLDFIKGKSEVVLFTDADEEIDVDDLEKVLSLYQNIEIDIVFGSRFLNFKNIDKFRMGIHRYLANKFLTLITNLIYSQQLTDMETAVKSFRTKLTDNLDLQSNGFDIEPEMVKELAKLKLKIYEVGISYNPRSSLEGKKISFKDGVITLFYLLKSR